MKFIYLILAHKYPASLKRLVESLDAENNYFIIHLDAKEPVQPFLNQFGVRCNDNVFFVPKRLPVYWGRFSMIEAIMYMIGYSFQLGLKADYYHLISVQDYPLKSNHEIKEFFIANNGKSFLEYFSLPSDVWYLDDKGKLRYHFKWYLNKEGAPYYSDLEMKNQLFTENGLPGDIKPYGGSLWWSLHYNCVKYLLEVCNEDNPLYNFYRYCLFPEEMIFNTLLLNSGLKNSIENTNMRLIKWNKITPAHPETLTLGHQQEISECEKLFARKFDPMVDHLIINQVEMARSKGDVKHTKKPSGGYLYPLPGKCCVISAVGKESLHKKWMGKNTNFDLHLMLYDNSYEEFKNDTNYIFQGKGQKFKLLYKYLSENNGLVNKYDYFYIPDDDIDIDAGNINKLFLYMKEYGLDIAQPAIYNNNFTYRHTLKHHHSIVRYTSFVEVMQPCFSRRALKKILFTFNENKSGWGIDYHWGQLVDFTKYNMAIIDDVKSVHTRPVRSNHTDDLKNYLKKFNLNFEIYENLK